MTKKYRFEIIVHKGKKKCWKVWNIDLIPENFSEAENGHRD